MSFSVLEPGLQSRIVDFGRPSSRSLGVPVGGAADRWSLALGNALVGNLPDAPALEVTPTGPTLRAEAQIGAVLFRAQNFMSMSMAGRKLPGSPLPFNEARFCACGECRRACGLTCACRAVSSHR